MERFSALIGFAGILAIAFLLSTNRRAIRWKTVFWGLTLQILIAIAVLKAIPIAHAFSAFMPPLNPWIASLIFIVLTVIVVQIAKRIGEGGGRKELRAVYLLLSAILFLSYRLLAFLLEKLEEVVPKLLNYPGGGPQFVFGALGDTANT